MREGAASYRLYRDGASHFTPQTALRSGGVLCNTLC